MTAPHISDPDDPYPMRDTGLTYNGVPIYVSDDPWLKGRGLVPVAPVPKPAPAPRASLWAWALGGLLLAVAACWLVWRLE